MNRRLQAALLAFALTCPVASAAEAGESNDRDAFSVRDVQGPTAFAFDGSVIVGAVVAPAAAVGRFTADGNGLLTDGVRILVVGGTALHQTFTCTYTVNPIGTGSATCIVMTGSVPSDESFDFVIVEKKKQAYFTATTPGVTIRGATKRQH